MYGEISSILVQTKQGPLVRAREPLKAKKQNGAPEARCREPEPKPRVKSTEPEAERRIYARAAAATGSAELDELLMSSAPLAF